MNINLFRRTSQKETLKEAGYKYIKYMGNKKHLLFDGNSYEFWCANKNHASYGLKYKNTHLEFVSGCGIKSAQFENFKKKYLNGDKTA